MSTLVETNNQSTNLDDCLIAARVAVRAAAYRRHRNPNDKREAINAARQIMSASTVLFLDTETTGIGDNDEIVEIAIIDAAGNALIDSRIKPSRRKRWPKAQEIHGISPADVKNAPTFDQVWPQIEDLIIGKTVVIYNAEYDMRLIGQSALVANVPDRRQRGKATFRCAMQIYSKFVGEWADYKNEYKWQKLPGSRAHSAKADSLATLALMKAIVETPQSEVSAVSSELSNQNSVMQYALAAEPAGLSLSHKIAFGITAICLTLIGFLLFLVIFCSKPPEKTSIESRHITIGGAH